MSSYLPVPLGSRFTTTLRSFAQGEGRFDEALPESQIQHVADDLDVHFGNHSGDIFTPAITLWTFLTQVLSGSKTCVAAVARTIVLRLVLGLTPCSAYTGA